MTQTKLRLRQPTALVEDLFFKVTSYLALEARKGGK